MYCISFSFNRFTRLLIVSPWSNDSKWQMRQNMTKHKSLFSIILKVSFATKITLSEIDYGLFPQNHLLHTRRWSILQKIWKYGERPFYPEKSTDNFNYINSKVLHSTEVAWFSTVHCTDKYSSVPNKRAVLNKRAGWNFTQNTKKSAAWKLAVLFIITETLFTLSV